MSSIFAVFLLFCVLKTSSQQTWSLPVSSTAALPLNHWWNIGVGSGHGSLALRTDWEDQLLAAKQAIGFTYVRFHGILDDDVGSVNGVNDYSFINIDNIYDYLLSINMKPYVEISFMPQVFASGDSTVFHYKGNITPPKNWDDWNNFIKAWMQHLLERYGENEVKTWYFEVWNEPNCGFYYEGGCCGCNCGSQQQYFDLYYNTITSIKSVSSSLQVGGPSTAQLCWINNFTNYMNTNNIEVDFVASHLYPTDPQVNQNNQIQSYYENLMNAYKAQVYNPPLPMVLSETNSGLYSSNTHTHDNEYASSFMLYMIPYLQSLINNSTWNWLSYWTFSDVFEEGGFNSSPFHNGFGMQSIRGIPKPVFRVLELVHKFDSDSYYMATPGDSSYLDTIQMYGTYENNTFVLFVSNFNAQGLSINNESISVDIPFSDESNIKVSKVTQYLIDEINSNAYYKWKSIGSPEYPTNDEMNTLMQASQIVSQEFNGYSVNNNILFLNFNISAYQCLIFECNLS